MVSITILILVVSFSYAYIKLDKQEKETNLLGTDCIQLEMEEVTDALTLTKTYPMTDENGEKTNPFVFKLRNNCGVGIDYQINLRVEETENKMNAINNIATKIDEYEKVVLSTNNKLTKEDNQEEYKISTNLSIEPYGEVEHRVRIWLEQGAGNDTQNKTFKSRIVIEATQNQIVEKYYKEAILHGADPVLNTTSEEPLAMQTASGEGTTTDTLVPIVIDEKNGTVRKADVTQEWYDYETKKWANAVILVDNNKANEIQPGEIIEEEKIESYFVWIPKYRYKIFDMGNTYTNVQPEDTSYQEKSHEIEIEFNLDNTTNEIEGECATPNKSGEDGTCKEGYWMTHPAFTAFPNSHGMWVGKFETGYKQDGEQTSWTKEGAEKNKQSSQNVIIKPNVFSWRNITVGNAYHTSYNYERDLDSHMMKNTEWGAVAYLSHSKYGTCTDKICTEVMINNTNNGLTGVSAMNAPKVGFNAYNDYGTVSPGENASESGNFKGAYNYNNLQSRVASTTGNYSGIYDMSGGSWEAVMGYLYNHPLGSGLTEDNDLTEKNSKYFDEYTNQKDTDWNKRILGDATGELGPFVIKKYGSIDNKVSAWYEENAIFVDSNSPWFARGASFDSGKEAGIFAIAYNSGYQARNIAFRIVLTPTNEAM